MSRSASERLSTTFTTTIVFHLHIQQSSHSSTPTFRRSATVNCSCLFSAGLAFNDPIYLHIYLHKIILHRLDRLSICNREHDILDLNTLYSNLNGREDTARRAHGHHLTGNFSNLRPTSASHLVRSGRRASGKNGRSKQKGWKTM